MRHMTSKGTLLALIACVSILPATPAFAACKKDQHLDPLIQKMDQNCNGKISKKEFDHYMNKRFDALDTNNDGYIENKELQAARHKAAKQAQEYRKRMQQREQKQKNQHQNGSK